ncbi:unnamed protein product [Somion occarium]|uniref:Cyclin-domain-containing protein n=1 Tax=Somion occarium TaxID=3059160 RepID=A0ABP1DKV5_9APHY
MEPSDRVQLPAGFENVDKNILAELIADMMDRLLAHNDQIPLSPCANSRLAARDLSPMKEFVVKVSLVSIHDPPQAFLFYSTWNICARIPTFTVSSLTCHRFLITSVALSSKALSDIMCQNKTYAKVGGIPMEELNMLEREFLRMIDWRLITTREVLQEYYVNLVRTHSKGKYIIVGAQSSSSVSSDSDMDYESSRPASPSSSLTAVGTNVHNQDWAPHELSSILINTTTLSPEPLHPPTVEQNMAFQAFQQSSGMG